MVRHVANSSVVHQSFWKLSGSFRKLSAQFWKLPNPKTAGKFQEFLESFLKGPFFQLPGTGELSVVGARTSYDDDDDTGLLARSGGEHAVGSGSLPTGTLQGGRWCPAQAPDRVAYGIAALRYWWTHQGAVTGGLPKVPHGLRLPRVPRGLRMPPRSWGASLPLGAYRRSRRPESLSSRNSMSADA